MPAPIVAKHAPLKSACSGRTSCAMLIALFLFLPLAAAAQASATPALPESTRAMPTAAHMRADFDQATGYLDAFSVHKDLSAQRLGIDYRREFARLRGEIGDDMDVCGFSRLLERTLHLVQDLHVGTMDYNYLKEYGKLQSRFNVAEDEAYSGVAAVERDCPAQAPTLDLPLMFLDGKYVVYADFTYHGVRVARGTALTSYNGGDIAAYIRNHLDSVWPVRVSTDGTLYNPRFYRAGEPEFRLGLSDGRELTMRQGDTVEWVTPRTHAIYFGSQTEARVLHFPEQHVLYIGIPMMDESLVETINAQVDEVARKGGRIDKIAIDIRGNGGGSDMTWRRVLSHLVGREMQFTLGLRMKDNPLARTHYPQEPAPAAEPVPLLGGARYWTHNANVIRFGPDPDSLRFTGPIYVLRDAFIYSSAANLANFANLDPQLVSVGDTSDLVGGAQIEPLFFKLDHSGLVFRIEPALDFAAVRSLDGFAHNSVEVPIKPSVEDQFLRSTWAGDVYGREFLLEHDPLFRYVVSRNRDAHQDTPAKAK